MTILGIFLLVAGIIIFILRLEKIKKMLESWDKRPNYILRLMGTIALIIGVLIIYSA